MHRPLHKLHLDACKEDLKTTGSNPPPQLELGFKPNRVCLRLQEVDAFPIVSETNVNPTLAVGAKKVSHNHNASVGREGERRRRIEYYQLQAAPRLRQRGEISEILPRARR